MGVIERKEREKEQRRAAILSAAEQLFLRFGFNNTTMEMIAAEIEMSRATIYLYYKNKEDIYLTIVRNALELLLEMMKKSVAGCNSAEEKLNAIGLCYLEFYRKHRNYFILSNLILDSDARELEPTLCRQKEKFIEVFDIDHQLWEIAITALQEGIDCGDFRNDIDPFDMTLSIWAASNGIIKLIDHIELTHTLKPDIDFGERNQIYIDRLYGKKNMEHLLTNTWEIFMNSIKQKNLEEK